MNILFAFFIEFLFFLVIIGMQSFLYSKSIGLSKRWKGLRLFFAILFVAAIESLLQMMALYGVSVYAGFSAYAILILYPVFIMGGKFKERLFFGLISCVLFLFSSLLSVLIVYTKGTDMPETFLKTLFLCFLILSIHTILIVVIAHLNTEGKRYIPHGYWVGATVCFGTIFVGYFIVLNGIKKWVQTDQFPIYSSIALFVFFVIWMLLYFIFYFVCRFFAKDCETTALAIQNDMIERYLLGKQASDERIRVLSHDLKHSLIQWRTLALAHDNQQALQAISEYEEQFQSAFVLNVENPNANAILHQKYWEAKQAQIQFVVDGIFDPELQVDKLDLCSLLGNLLDNGIEAASQVESIVLRIVRLNIRRRGNLLILNVENSYAISPIRPLRKIL